VLEAIEMGDDRAKPFAEASMNSIICKVSNVVAPVVPAAECAFKPVTEAPQGKCVKDNDFNQMAQKYKFTMMGVRTASQCASDCTFVMKSMKKKGCCQWVGGTKEGEKGTCWFYPAVDEPPQLGQGKDLLPKHKMIAVNCGASNGPADANQPSTSTEAPKPPNAAAATPPAAAPPASTKAAAAPPASTKAAAAPPVSTKAAAAPPAPAQPAAVPPLPNAPAACPTSTKCCCTNSGFSCSRRSKEIRGSCRNSI